jgi:hypothetical protein
MKPPAAINPDTAAKGMIKITARASPRYVAQYGDCQLQPHARSPAINAVKASIAAADAAVVLQKLTRCFAMTNARARLNRNYLFQSIFVQG